MILKERVEEEIKEKKDQIRRQFINDIRSYLMQKNKWVISFPNNNPLTFVVSTYAIIFVLGMLVGIIF